MPSDRGEVKAPGHVLLICNANKWVNSSVASHVASNQSFPEGLVAGPEVCSQATLAEMLGFVGNCSSSRARGCGAERE